MEKQWYVFYTKSRWEKKVLHLLERRGFETFLPLHKVMRQWSDRKKKVEVPLFNSYIFVRVLKNQLYDVLQVPGVVKNLVYNGEPAVLRDSEYSSIKRWLETGYIIEVTGVDANFSLGQMVKIQEGAFKGIEGEVHRVDDTTCCVVIESLQQVLNITLRKEYLQEIS